MENFASVVWRFIMNAYHSYLILLNFFTNIGGVVIVIAITRTLPQLAHNWATIGFFIVVFHRLWLWHWEDNVLSLIYVTCYGFHAWGKSLLKLLYNYSNHSTPCCMLDFILMMQFPVACWTSCLYFYTMPVTMPVLFHTFLSFSWLTRRTCHGGPCKLQMVARG